MHPAQFAKKCWLALRAATGDDAYERYLAHWREHHAHQGGAALSRAAFFKQELERKWDGVKRCC
jgi:uncharacterized short protein YbdD (DUF466 family)